MDGFKPKLKLTTELTMIYNAQVTDEKLYEMTGLGNLIYKNAVNALKEAVANGSKSLVLSLVPESLNKEYIFNERYYSYSILWETIKNLASDDELLFYEVGQGQSILTF